MAQRGRTGLEGNTTKGVGLLIAAIGLLWGGAMWFLSESASSLTLPAVLLVGGVIAFLVGRNITRAHRISGSE